MGLFKRPTMEDRMVNSEIKRQPWWKKAEAKEEAKAYERAVRHEKHRAEAKRPYGGSDTQAGHRGWFS